MLADLHHRKHPKGGFCATCNLKLLERQLKDDSNDLTRDLLLCGPEVMQDMRNAFYSEELLDNIAEKAHKRMSTLTSSSLCWRRLYTDCCVARSLLNLASAEEPSTTTAIRSIVVLDKAIIIAGAPGRLDEILDYIRVFQRLFFNSKHSTSFPPQIPLPQAEIFYLQVSTNEIPILDPAPSFTSFAKTSLAPFILRGHLNDWPAMQDHPWSSIDYMRSIAGPGRIVPVEVGSDYRDEEWTQQLMPWDDFLASLGSEDAELLYLAQHNLLKQFPALRDDILIPDYVYACPEAPPAEYVPPGTDDLIVTNVWLGPKGTVSPAHTDPYYNLYAQVVGYKTVWLAPPSSSPYMCAYPSTTQTQAQAHNPAANTLNPSMSNTSQVDVFADTSENVRFPVFWEKVIPYAMSATLGPGDMLFFPPGWWHAMRSESRSCSVSMWF